MNRKPLKILIYGVCPYGNGGVSHHSKRLLAYLDQKRSDIDIRYYHHDQCYSPARCNRKADYKDLFALYRSGGFDIVQIYSLINWKIQLVTLLGSFLYDFRIILSLRNDRFPDTYSRLRRFEKVILRLLCRRAERFICVNRQADYLFIDPGKITFIPGYIEPSEEEYAADLPAAMLEFMASHRRTLASNATASKIHDGIDLYGFDLAVGLMTNLKQRGFQDVGLLFILPEMTPSYEPHYREMLRRINMSGLVADVLVWTRPVSFPAVLKRCDISLRLTSRDGDSSSVRESLSLGTPVVASDAAPRPDGVVLFKSRDLDDLTLKTAHLLDHLEDWRTNYQALGAVDNAGTMVQLWRSVA